MSENTQDACPFCDPGLQARAVGTWGSVLAVPDTAPVAEGHLLVITRRHAEDIFEMTAREYRDAMRLLASLRQQALRDDPSITGFNVGANCGESAGQKVMHAHIHFIPRREGDGPDGRGVKGVIRNKFSY
ncbi:MAG TPA: HIT family protein [Phycisphaerae bacterium]|nr:HIT family protein [Phycisphaerae bacterium]